MKYRFRLVTLLCAVVWSVPAFSADWPQFRGLRFGEATDSRPLPADIGPTSHVIWKTALPPGHSSPIIVKDRIFLTAVRDGKSLRTIALERVSGKILWEREAAYEKLETIHRIGSYAQCSPASDGQFVVSFFGSSGLWCYDLEGTPMWNVRMGPFNDDFGAASSPVILDNRVVLGQDHDTGSFLAAYDLGTGKEVWRTDRSEFSRNFGSPVIWNVEGERQIVIAGTLRVCGYDAETGRERWTVRGLSRVVCPTPVVGPDNTLFVAGWSAGGEPGERIALEPFTKVVEQLDTNRNGSFERDEIKEGPLDPRFTQCDRNKDGRITKAEYEEFQMLFDRSQNVVMAIRPGGTGDLTDTNVKWKFEKFVPFCSSPLLYRDRLFTIKDGGILTCLDAATGRALKTGRVSGTGAYYASPVGGDGKIYLCSEQGKLSVITAENSWQVIHSADFSEEIYGSPAIVDGRIYLRTNGHLYCFGSAQDT